MSRNTQEEPIDDAEIIDVEADVKRATEMPRDLALLKMDHETIVAAAAIRPRNNTLILKELLSIIDAYPAAADDAVYSKPVGTVFAIKCAKCGNRFEAADSKSECPKCGSPGSDKDEVRKVKKYAEGLSIRAAETIRSIYGANSLRITEQDLPDGKVRLTGVFVDYATATMTSDERTVSPWYKRRGGGMEKIAEDRFLSLTVKAEKAKLRRDLILDAVPAILKAAFRDACEKKIMATVTAGYVEDNILPFLRTIGLTEADAETIVGKPRSMGWTNEEVATLRHVCSALKNGEYTKEQLFEELREIRDQDNAQRMPTEPIDGANTVDLTKPKGGKTKRPGKEPEKEREEPESVPKSEEPQAEEKPAEKKKPNASSMFGGDDEPAEEPLDGDIFNAMCDRIAKAVSLADTDRAEAEVKKMKMNTAQRGALMNAIQKRRKEFA